MSMFKPAKDRLAELFSRARSINTKYFDRLMSRLSNTQDLSTCWEYKLGVNEDGYGSMCVDGKKDRIHRLMFRWFFPDVACDVVRHLCNNPRCCNPQHLRGGTQLDNIRDRVLAGRDGFHKGTANGRSKLNEQSVLEIRNSSESYTVLASRYGVSKTVIKNVKLRLSWKHV
jgi:hypothetical protein